MSPIKAILFDLDGTLVDTISLYADAVIASFAEKGIPLSREFFRKTYQESWHIRDILQHFGLGEAHIPDYRSVRDRLYIELLRTKSDWLPGAQELLGSLTNKKTPIGLITGSWMTYVDAIDQNLDVKKYFSPIITADEIHKFMKPHPHGLLLAADRLGVDPKDCVYIGDQAFDMEAAERAGMRGIFVESEWGPKNVYGDKLLTLKAITQLIADAR